MRLILNSSLLRRIGAAGALGAVALLGAAACSADKGSATGRPLVLATTPILGDVIMQIAGDTVDVETLMPRGADPHSFEASARQAARIREAELVVANGLGLEERLVDTLEAAASDGVEVVEVAPRLEPRRTGASDAASQDEDHHGEFDPHVWMDPVRMERGVEIIGEHLATVAPTTEWSERVEAYREEISAAHDEIGAILDAVPDERRRLVTDHDSLAYFAARYDLEVVGTIAPGLSTLGAASAEDLARLTETIREHEIRAVFVEASQPDRLARALADEVGADVEVVTLLAGTLDEPSSPAGTYLGMLLADARTIAETLT